MSFGLPSHTNKESVLPSKELFGGLAPKVVFVVGSGAAGALFLLNGQAGAQNFDCETSPLFDKLGLDSSAYNLGVACVDGKVIIPNNNFAELAKIMKPDASSKFEAHLPTGMDVSFLDASKFTATYDSQAPSISWIGFGKKPEVLPQSPQSSPLTSDYKSEKPNVQGIANFSVDVGNPGSNFNPNLGLPFDSANLSPIEKAPSFPGLGMVKNLPVDIQIGDFRVSKSSNNVPVFGNTSTAKEPIGNDKLVINSLINPNTDIQTSQPANQSLGEVVNSIVGQNSAGSVLFNPGYLGKVSNGYDGVGPVTNLDTQGLPIDSSRVDSLPVEFTTLPEGLKGYDYVNKLVEMTPAPTIYDFRRYLQTLQNHQIFTGNEIRLEGFVAHTASMQTPSTSSLSAVGDYLKRETNLSVQCAVGFDGLGIVFAPPNQKSAATYGANDYTTSCEANAAGIPGFNPDLSNGPVSSANGVTPQVLISMANHAVYSYYVGESPLSIEEYITNSKGHHEVGVDLGYSFMEQASNGVFKGDRSDWPAPLGQVWREQYIRPLFNQLQQQGVVDKASFLSWVQNPVNTIPPSINSISSNPVQLPTLPVIETKGKDIASDVSLMAARSIGYPVTQLPSYFEILPPASPNQPMPGSKFTLIPPANLGALDSDGRVQMPEPMQIGFGSDKKNLYSFYSNTEQADRCGIPATMIMYNTMAVMLRAEFPNMADFEFGDADAGEDEHVSHNKASLDIPTGDHSVEVRKAMVRIAWDSGLVSHILHNDPEVIRYAQNYTGISDFVIYYDNHDTHFHLEMNPAYSESARRACLDDFDYSTPINLPEIDSSVENSSANNPGLASMESKNAVTESNSPTNSSANISNLTSSGVGGGTADEKVNVANDTQLSAVGFELIVEQDGSLKLVPKTNNTDVVTETVLVAEGGTINYDSESISEGRFVPTNNVTPVRVQLDNTANIIDEDESKSPQSKFDLVGNIDSSSAGLDITHNHNHAQPPSQQSTMIDEVDYDITDLPPQWSDLFREVSESTKVPPKILAAILWTENGGKYPEYKDSWATSPGGDMGAFQISQSTWKALGSGDPQNPKDSAVAAARLIQSLNKDGLTIEQLDNLPLGTIEELQDSYGPLTILRIAMHYNAGYSSAKFENGVIRWYDVNGEYWGDWKNNVINRYLDYVSKVIEKERTNG